MQAMDVMTRKVATVRPDTTIPEAIAKMVGGHISGLPVLDGKGQLVGILTEGDLLRRTELGTTRMRPGWLNFLRGPDRSAAEYVRAGTLKVDDIMTPNPVAVSSTTALEEVVAAMEREGVRRVPVVDDGKLAGIVSRADLVRALGRVMGAHADAPGDDLGIRASILGELGKQNWFHSSNISVQVRHGAVQLDGLVQSDAVRMALRVASERMPGVVSVDNRVEVLNPMMSVSGV